MATFALIYSTQALLPEFARAFADLRRAEHAVGVADHHRPGRRAAGRRPAVGGGRPDAADPPLAGGVRGGGGRLRARADLARAAGPAAAAGRHAGRAARRRDRVPARGAAPEHPRPGGRPLHRRHRHRRDDRPPGHRADRRRRRLAVGAGRRSPPSAWSAPSSCGCCCRPRGTSSPRRRAPAVPGCHDAAGPDATRRCWRCTRSAPARSARSWRSTTRWASGSPPRRSTWGSAPRAWCSSSIPIGTVGSIVAGRLADRFSRRAVVPVGCLIVAAGVLLTLPASLPVVVLGLAVMTAGFFAVHGVASGWVPARAHAGGVAAGQAASLYLFAYYLGSSVFGSLTGRAWTVGAWPGVVVLAVGARPGQRAARPLAPRRRAARAGWPARRDAAARARPGPPRPWRCRRRERTPVAATSG